MKKQGSTNVRHTKGPWIVHQVYTNDPVQIRDEEGELVIACIPKNFVNQTKDNARLIAAAPDLYESLKIVQAISKSIDTKEPSTIGALARIEEQLKFALAKAEGREE